MLGLGMWAGLGEDLYLPLGGVGGSERVRTITNDLADACALLESQSQRAILEDCLWNVGFSQQPLRSNPLVDSSPLIGFDSPLKPLPSRGTPFMSPKISITDFKQSLLHFNVIVLHQISKHYSLIQTSMKNNRLSYY